MSPVVSSPMKLMMSVHLLSFGLTFAAGQDCFEYARTSEGSHTTCHLQKKIDSAQMSQGAQAEQICEQLCTYMEDDQGLVCTHFGIDETKTTCVFYSGCDRTRTAGKKWDTYEKQEVECPAVPTEMPTPEPIASTTTAAEAPAGPMATVWTYPLTSIMNKRVCGQSHLIAEHCTGCDVESCKSACSADADCAFIAFSDFGGICNLYDGCSEKTELSVLFNCYKKSVDPRTMTAAAPAPQPAEEPVVLVEEPLVILEAVAPELVQLVEEPVQLLEAISPLPVEVVNEVFPELHAVAPVPVQIVSESFPEVSENAQSQSGVNSDDGNPPVPAPSCDPEYPVVKSDTVVTCAKDWIIARQFNENADIAMCSEACDMDDTCKFFGLSTKGTCVTYSGCETERSTDQLWATYERVEPVGCEVPAPAPVPSTSCEPEYPVVKSDTVVTCAKDWIIERHYNENADIAMCSDSCSMDENCEYFSLSDKGTCVTYSGCDTERSSGQTWATYQRVQPVDCVPEPTVAECDDFTRDVFIGPLSSTTCDKVQMIRKETNGGASLEFCAQACEVQNKTWQDGDSDGKCTFFGLSESGVCILYDACTVTRESTNKLWTTYEIAPETCD